jgi:carbamoyltransferase
VVETKACEAETMLFFGVGSFGHDSAVALLDDTSIVAAVEEEKLSRSTGMGGIPRLAMARCLDQAGAKLSDLQLTGIAKRPGAAWVREAAFRLKLMVSRPGAADWTRAIGRNARELTQLRHLRRMLGESVPVAQFEHHLCHAASAFYTSPFDRALIITLDECGDMWAGLVSNGKGEEISPLRALRFPNSVGWFYTRVTELLGLRPHRDEHKVQWLSKDGQPEFVGAFRKLFRRDSRGLPMLAQKYFARGTDDRGTLSAAFYRELGIPASGVGKDTSMRASLARSAQDFLEEVVLDVVERYRIETGSTALCVAGGVFLNVFLVRALETRSGFRNVYVQPAAGNSGTALGAALLARKGCGGTARQKLTNMSLGPGFSSAQIKAVLDNSKIIYKYPSGEEQLCTETARLLRNDKIVAWFQGRTEFGHRALGHRSILASPFSEYVIENVNQYIKHREDFHPFALSVPAELASKFFDVTENCQFMGSIGRLTSAVPGLERLTFNEGSVRVHTVDRLANPLFWRLLHKFGEQTPAPVLVNTSFNLFGEPLVCDPREAIRSFYCAGIDALAIGSFLVVK